MNSESANRFIAALVKSLQTLCHGYVDFDDGIEIIGHLYLNIDSGATFDYVLKEKVCKNAENSTVFVSKSFHAEGKPENTLIQSDKGIDPSHNDGQATNIGDNGMSPSGTTRLQSAITNISNVLSGNAEQHSTHTPHPLNAGRRKRDHNGSYSNQNLPYKYTTLQSSSSSAMPYFTNSAKQHSSGRDGSKHYNASQSQGEFFGGDSNQSSALGGDDEEDLALDVTFVKEEYQERHRAGHLSRTHQADPSSNQTNISENNPSGGVYPMGYHPGTQSQQFTGSGGAASSGGELSSGINQSFQDPSQVDTGQHHIPAAPNPRTRLTSPDGFSKPQSFSLESDESSSRGHSVIHTIRQNKWAVGKAREWLSSQGMSTNFEQFSDIELNQMMLNFYTSAQKKDGAPFSGTALLAFRTALTRYMNQQGRNISLATSHAFKPSNAVLSRIMSCSVKVNRVISTPDIILLYTSGALDNSNPESLLYKIWFELQIHFRNRVPWHKVSTNQFKFSLDSSNKVYVTWNTAGFGGMDQVTIQPIANSKHCTVESLKIYLQKRNQLCSTFLQVPCTPEFVARGMWFAQEEFKDAREKGFMKRLSLVAKLSRSYTNACISNSSEEFFHAMNSLSTTPN